MTRVSMGIRKLFSKLSPSVTTQSPPGPGTLIGLGQAYSERQDAKADHEIILKTLKHLCDKCKTLGFIRGVWYIESNWYKPFYRSVACKCLETDITWKANRHIYRYTCYEFGHSEVMAHMVICIHSPDGSLTLWRERLPQMDSHLYATLSSMERADIRLAIQWIEVCRQSHVVTCGKNVDNDLPGLTVIDCISGQICARRSGRPYVALSYVWGPSPTRSHPVLGKFPVSFPRTIQDAMLVANELSVPYLWVDRYCIDQNNEQEKHIMISNMDKIYAGAELTIIAAAGSDPDYGLPGISTTKRRGFSTHTSSHSSLMGCSNATYETANSSWATRGWTYQEMLLSRRRLVFTDSQMFFQCCGREFQEALRILPCQFVSDNATPPASHLARLGCPRLHLPKNTYTSVFPENGIGTSTDEIYCRIAEYTGRRLSYPGDILNAFEGIFGAFGRIIPGDGHNFWGVPIRGYSSREMESFVRGLSWHVSEPAIRRPGCWPSWSWTSVMDKSITFCLPDLSSVPLGVLGCNLTRTNGAKEDIPYYVKAHRECATLEYSKVASSKKEANFPSSAGHWFTQAKIRTSFESIST
jgi:hypothetical protein